MRPWPTNAVTEYSSARLQKPPFRNPNID